MLSAHSEKLNHNKKLHRQHMALFTYTKLTVRNPIKKVEIVIITLDSNFQSMWTQDFSISFPACRMMNCWVYLVPLVADDVIVVKGQQSTGSWDASAGRCSAAFTSRVQAPEKLHCLQGLWAEKLPKRCLLLLFTPRRVGASRERENIKGISVACNKSMISSSSMCC